MFCIECGQKLPDNAKFCSRCGTAVNNISNTTPPSIMDDVAAKAEDVVITDEMPSLDAQGVNDDVLRKASFLGFQDEQASLQINNRGISNNKVEDKDVATDKSRKTFFGGELILETVKYSNNDTACYFVDKCPIVDRLKSAVQSSIGNVFIVTRISDGKKTYLRYSGVEKKLIQDVAEWFDAIEDFHHNFSVVKLGSKYGYVYSNGTKVIWKFDCIFDRATSFAYFTDDTSKQSDILTAKVQIKDLPYFILEDGKVIADKGKFTHKVYIFLFIFINIIFLIIGLCSNLWVIFSVDIVYLGWWRWIFRTYSRYEYIKTIQAKK